MPSPYKPFTFKRTGAIVPNRAVLAAMTNKQSQPNGEISDEEINWLMLRAEGSFGIITTAASHVSKDGQGWEGEIGVFDDKLATSQNLDKAFMLCHFLLKLI